MADLETMYKNGMGSVASFYGGQQMSQDQELNQIKMDAARQKMQQDAVLNPLEAQFKQGQIAQQAAQLPGIVGQSQSHAVEGQNAVDMAATKLASQLSSAATKLGQDGMDRIGQQAERYGMAAGIIKGLPPIAHKEAIKSIIEKSGGDVNDPVFAQIMKLPDENVAKALEIVHKGFALSSRKFVQEQELKQQENASQERINTKNNEAKAEVARIAAEARKAVAEARGKAVKHMSTDQAIAYLSGIEDPTPQEQEQLVKLSQQRIAERTASASGVAPQVLGQATPQQTGNATAATIWNGTGQKPKEASSLGDAVKATGWAYEPDKYDYQIDPKTGKVQRAPKLK